MSSRRMAREMHPSKPTPTATRPVPTAPRPENAEPTRDDKSSFHVYDPVPFGQMNRKEDELISRVVERMANDRTSIITPEMSKQWAKERLAAREALKRRMRVAKTNEDHARLSAQLEAITTPADRKAEAPLAVRAIEMIPTAAGRDIMRLITHGLAHTGNTVLKTLDIPNRIFGGSRSLLQDMYEEIDQNVAQDSYERFPNGAAKVGETAVSLATAGEAFGSALPAVFGTNVGTDTYEAAKASGASTGEALAKGVAHGVVDTAIWTLGQGLSSRHLPKAWQWLGREITGALRGAASSVTSDAVYNSLGADITPGEMAKRAVHAAWMVPLLGMVKMGGKRRQEAEALIRKARPELAGAKTSEIIDTVEKEFLDPKSQKIAIMWVARKGANLPDDVAQIKQALEVAGKVKGLDPMSKSPFEILSDPRYARYLPKPKPQDVKAFSNMKRYPMGVIGFDVSDDAAGRQATREMINAYMSPSSNPWCLATGKDAAKLGGLGPDAEHYWKEHSAVPKQIFFQEVNGKLELTAFRATSSGGEGRQEYWDTSDAGYSGIPIKVKVPGDPMGRYRKMVFRPASQQAPDTVKLTPNGRTEYNEEQLREYIAGRRRNLEAFQARPEDFVPDAVPSTLRDIELAERGLETLARRKQGGADGEVQGTFEDIAPGEVFKGDPFRDGRTQTWVKQPSERDGAAGKPDWEIDLNEGLVPVRDRGRLREITADPNAPYVLVEDKVRTTENGITKFRTTKYADPTNWDYEPPKPGEAPKPVEIEESELVSPEWMRSRGYNPESESDVRRMQQELNIQPWGNGQEAAMAVVPTKRTLIYAGTGAETVEYGPNGQDIVAKELTRDGVPYRYEYFQSGPAEADSDPVYDTLNTSDLPRPHGGIGGHRGFRLIRNPGTDAREVLDELKWDEGLNSFVRTRGNRRWRVDVGTEESSEGRRLYNKYEDAMVALASKAEEVGDAVGINDPRFESLISPERAAERTALNEWTAWAIDNGIDPYDTYGSRKIIVNERPTLVAEDLQPDGTWAPAPNFAPRRVHVTSDRDRAISEYADTHGGDIPNWATVTDDEIEEWARRADEVEQLPPPPEVIPIPAELTEPAEPDDIPFALKAGRTRRDIHADNKGGETSNVPDPETRGPDPQPAPEPSTPARIVINPKVFKDKRDGLCVAYNEAFRILMAENGFEPQAEPTEEQRKFFSDTAYADDELMLRRTILARICTFDTSVENPTDEQLDEALEFLETVMEIGAPQSEEEQANVQRIHDIIAKVRQSPRPEEQKAEAAPEPPADETAEPTAALGAGNAREDPEGNASAPSAAVFTPTGVVVSAEVAKGVGLNTNGMEKYPNGYVKVKTEDMTGPGTARDLGRIGAEAYGGEDKYKSALTAALMARAAHYDNADEIPPEAFLDPESIPIVPEGQTGHWTKDMLSRSSRNGRPLLKNVVQSAIAVTGGVFPGESVAFAPNKFTNTRAGSDLLGLARLSNMVYGDKQTTEVEQEFSKMGAYADVHKAGRMLDEHPSTLAGFLSWVKAAASNAGVELKGDDRAKAIVDFDREEQAKAKGKKRANPYYRSFVARVRLALNNESRGKMSVADQNLLRQIRGDYLWEQVADARQRRDDGTSIA